MTNHDKSYAPVLGALQRQGGQNCHTYLCLSHNTDFHVGQNAYLSKWAKLISRGRVKISLDCETTHISTVRTRLTLSWNAVNTIEHACIKRRDEYD